MWEAGVMGGEGEEGNFGGMLSMGCIKRMGEGNGVLMDRVI